MGLTFEPQIRVPFTFQEYYIHPDFFYVFVKVTDQVLIDAGSSVLLLKTAYY